MAAAALAGWSRAPGSPALVGAGAASAATAFGAPLDPTDTDVYVNRFLKATVAGGAPQTLATGTWWGPPAISSSGR